VSVLLFAGCVVGVTDGFGFVMGETKPTDRWRSEELAFVVLFRDGDEPARDH
jgi:hypothetical protein